MRILILILFTFPGLCKSQEDSSSDIDDDITLVKKPMIILPTSTHPNESLEKKVISIISEQATTIGRFDVIDRNMVDKILEEQEFQLSGLVKKNDITKVGEFAAAEIALLLEIIHFGQKGIPMTVKKVMKAVKVKGKIINRCLKIIKSAIPELSLIHI